MFRLGLLVKLLHSVWTEMGNTICYMNAEKRQDSQPVLSALYLLTLISKLRYLILFLLDVNIPAVFPTKIV